MALSAVLKSFRLPFLILTPVCVAVGLATALTTAQPVQWGHFWLALAGALAAHIGVNCLNEYQDYRSGLDTLTCRTPFSGGSGSLIAHPDSAGAVRWAGYLSLVLTGLIGLYFVAQYGWAIIPIGLLGMTIVVAYTPWLNRYPWLCLMAPGMAFGPLMVVGTHFVMTGHYSSLAAFASLIPFLVVNNLLLLNQFPDVHADRQVGRRHLPIVYGLRFSTQVYGAMVVAAMMAIVVGTMLAWLPMVCLLALVPLSAGLAAYVGALRFAGQTARLVPFLGLNVVVSLMAPLVLSLTLAFG